MAPPAYSTDLTTIVDFDTTTFTPAEPSGWAAGRSPTTDTDFPIQGTTHASLTMNSTGDAGMVADATNFTWTSGDYLFGWGIWLAPSTINEYDNTTAGGLVMLTGSSSSDLKVFYVGGSNYGSYPYGGWQNFVVDPELTGDETNIGTPSGTDFSTVGFGARVHTAVSKGNPLGFDVFRYGRGELSVINGDITNGYATFSGMALANDANTARWGLFQQVKGGYNAKGLVTLGSDTTPVEFVDSNKNITVDVTPKVNSSFNRLEVRNISSVIEWNNINITQALTDAGSGATTASKWSFEAIDDVPITKNTCVFTDDGTFIYQSNSTLNSVTYRRCDTVTGGTHNNTTFNNATGTSAASSTTLNNYTDCVFTSSGTGFGVDISGTQITTNTTMSWNNTSSGYADTTGNRTIKVDVTTGNTLTINNNTGDTIYVENIGGGSVSIVTGQRTKTFNITNATSDYEYRIYTVTALGSMDGAVEVQGVESSSSSSQSYTYSYSAGIKIAFQILDHTNVYEEATFYYELPDANTTENLTLKEDTND